MSAKHSVVVSKVTDKHILAKILGYHTCEKDDPANEHESVKRFFDAEVVGVGPEVNVQWRPRLKSDGYESAPTDVVVRPGDRVMVLCSYNVWHWRSTAGHMVLFSRDAVGAVLA